MIFHDPITMVYSVIYKTAQRVRVYNYLHLYLGLFGRSWLSKVVAQFWNLWQRTTASLSWRKAGMAANGGGRDL